MEFRREIHKTRKTRENPKYTEGKGRKGRKIVQQENEHTTEGGKKQKRG